MPTLFIGCDCDNDCGMGREDSGGFRRFAIPLGRHRNRRRTFPSFIIIGGAGTHASCAFIFATWSTLKSSVSSNDVRSIIILNIGKDDDDAVAEDDGESDDILFCATDDVK